jgi:hypothetical protein
MTQIITQHRCAKKNGAPEKSERAAEHEAAIRNQDIV